MGGGEWVGDRGGHGFVGAVAVGVGVLVDEGDLVGSVPDAGAVHLGHGVRGLVGVGSPEVSSATISGTVLPS